MEEYTHLEGAWVLTDAALCIEKDDLDPDSVTAVLGIQPSGIRKPGRTQWRPAGDANGLWILECNDRTTQDLHEQVEHVLAVMESKRQELHNLISSGCDAYFRIYGFVGNGATFKLSPSTLAQLASLDIDLRILPNVSQR
ncbi:DUF4279 domain-containing protein [Streptomyces asiaticus]